MPLSGNTVTITPSRIRAGQIEAGAQRRAARHAGQHAFFLRQPPRQLVRALGRDAHVLVGQQRIVDAGPDRRLHVLEPLDAVQRRIGLNRDQPDVATMLAQAPADADERAARAEAGDEMRHAAVGLRQDLGRRRLVVRPPVGVVVVLVGVEVPFRVARRTAGALRGSRRPSLPSGWSARARRRTRAAFACARP